MNKYCLKLKKKITLKYCDKCKHNGYTNIADCRKRNIVIKNK